MKAFNPGIEPYRQVKAERDIYGGTGDATNGVFRFRSPEADGGVLYIVVSAGGGWDHVSVSRTDRIPTWEEMEFIKGKFFDAEEVVMQLHPARSRYVNFHPRCLHLWRPQAVAIPLPPPEMVGPVGEQQAEASR